MRTKQAGFNLVELMIALVVGVVLMASITTMFVDTKVSANRSSTVANLQQQAQLALQILVDDVRSIGSFAEFSGEPLKDITTPETLSLDPGSCSLFPNEASRTTGKFSLPESANWVKAASSAILVEADCISDSSAGSDDDGGYSMASNSDVLSIARIQGTSIAVADIQNGYYLAVSAQQTELFKGSAPGGATSIDNAEFYPYLHHTYFVETHADEGPRLTRFARQGDKMINDLIVSNIEAFQINFGIDTDWDGQPDNYFASDSVTDEMWTTNQIVTARIYVLARADNPDLTFNNDANYNLRFTPFSPPNNDNYRRFLLATTVVIKNNMMAVAQ